MVKPACDTCVVARRYCWFRAHHCSRWWERTQLFNTNIVLASPQRAAKRSLAYGLRLSCALSAILVLLSTSLALSVGQNKLPALTQVVSSIDTGLPHYDYAGAPDSWDPSVVQPPSRYLVRQLIYNGKLIDEIVVPGRPPANFKPIAVNVPRSNSPLGTVSLSNVPAFDWSYGCSATSAAMMMGYYDNSGYPNMYAGPTNGGVCPMNNSAWGAGECPLSATHQGYDGRNIKGHVDDYWRAYNNCSADPYVGNWSEHTWGECTGDYMGTNQSKYGNCDASTTFYNNTDGSPLYDYTGCEPSQKDGCHGMKAFAQSRGYQVSTNYSQYIYGYNGNTLGFTFAQFMTEIDEGRPVMIQVTGHSMVGYGYDSSSQTVYIHNTWDYNNYQMTWGGTYSGMQHYGVTVLRLTACTPPVSPTSASNNGPVCSGVNVTLTATRGSGTTLRWLTDSCTGASVGTGNNLVVFPTSTTTYYARWENGCGNSSCVTTTVTVNALSAPTNTFANPSTICAGGSSTLSATPGSGGDTIVWYSGSCGGTLAGTGTALSVSPTSTRVYYAKTKNSTAGCLSSSCASGVTVTVMQPPALRPVIAQDTTLCLGSGTNIQVIASENGVSYQLKTEAGASVGSPVAGTGSTINLPTDNLTTTTQFKVEATRSPCSVVTMSSHPTVTVNQPPAQKTVSAEAGTVCSGSGTNIQVASSDSGVSYQLKTEAGVAVGSSVTGTGSTINLPTGSLTTTTQFKVEATTSPCDPVTMTTDHPTVTVDTMPPSQPTIEVTPRYTNTTDVSVAFSGSVGGDFNRYEGQVDSGGYTTWTSPHTITVSGLTQGQHTVDVRSVDNCGNASSPASSTFAVDNIAPVINSVGVSPAMVAGGDAVHAVVDATDNVAVTSVTANGTALALSGASTWAGDIFALDLLGVHNVTIVANDAAGNSAANASATYKTAQIVGTSNKAAWQSVMDSACGIYLFKFWGRVAEIDDNYFTLSDGSGAPITVHAPGYKVKVLAGDYASARGILNIAGSARWIESAPGLITKY